MYKQHLSGVLGLMRDVQSNQRLFANIVKTGTFFIFNSWLSNYSWCLHNAVKTTSYLIAKLVKAKPSRSYDHKIMPFIQHNCRSRNYHSVRHLETHAVIHPVVSSQYLTLPIRSVFRHTKTRVLRTLKRNTPEQTASQSVGLNSSGNIPSLSLVCDSIDNLSLLHTT